MSHAAVLPAYQKKWRVLCAAHPEVTVTLVTPKRWKEGGRLRECQPAYSGQFAVRPRVVRFEGKQFVHHYVDLRSEFKNEHPDVIHLDEEPPSVVAWQVCQARNRWVPTVPIVVTAWENVNHRRPWYSSRRYLYRYCEMHVYRNVSAAVAGTGGAEEVLRQRGFRKPIHVFPTLCVDTEQFQPRNAEGIRQGLDLTPPIVGYVGRLLPEKGVQLLVEATALAGERWSLLLLGGGPERERLQSLANDLGIGDRFRMNGEVSIQDNPEWMNALDVLVLPSRSTALWKEQFGRVLVEAMAAGVPVVGSDCGSIPEIVGEAGLLFPEGNVQKLCECLELALDPCKHGDLSRRGRARAEGEFTNERTSEQLMEVYRSVLGKAPSLP